MEDKLKKQIDKLKDFAKSNNLNGKRKLNRYYPPHDDVIDITELWITYMKDVLLTKNLNQYEVVKQHYLINHPSIEIYNNETKNYLRFAIKITEEIHEKFLYIELGELSLSEESFNKFVADNNLQSKVFDTYDQIYPPQNVVEIVTQYKTIEKCVEESSNFVIDLIDKNYF